jgi:hypothetical protein
MSTDLTKNDKPKLPTLEELQYDVEIAFKNDQLNYLLNQQPPSSWLKPHPFVNVKNDEGKTVPLKYMPIEKTEFLLTKIFQRWSVEVISTGVMFQSVYVHVRLKVINPLNGLEMSQDGLGAAAIQTDAGASAADLSKIKNSAVMMALPSAESYAIKDAAEKFGRIFGKDLNRNTVIGDNAYSALAEKWMNKEALSQALNRLKLAKTYEELAEIRSDFNDLEGDKEFERSFEYYRRLIVKS